MRNWPTIILTLCLWASAIVGLIIVPAGTDIAVHWDFAGEADGFLPRVPALFMMPVLGLIPLAIMPLASRFTPREQFDNGRFIGEAAVSACLLVFAAIQLALVLLAAGYEIEMMRIVAGAIGALLIILGNVLPKSRINRYAGLRLPWTLKDARIWQAAHRLAGRLMMPAGALLIVLALCIGWPQILLAAIVLAVAVPTLVASIASYRLARRSGTL